MNILFIKDYEVIISPYIEDPLIFNKNVVGINETKKFLTSIFKMKDINKINTILGIKVTRHGNSFALNQSYYIEKMLNKFNYHGIKKKYTPSNSSIKLKENKVRVIS